MGRAKPKNPTPQSQIREMQKQMGSTAPNILKELKPNKVIKEKYVGEDTIPSRAQLLSTNGNLLSVSKGRNTHRIQSAKMHNKLLAYSESIYDPSFCEVIQDLGREGYNSLEMMSHLNVSAITWSAWLSNHEEFAIAYSIAKVHSGASHYTRIRLANRMFDIAKHKYLLESPFLDIKEEETKKIDPKLVVDFDTLPGLITLDKLSNIDGIEISEGINEK